MLDQFAGKLFDSHCHLNDSSFNLDRDQVVRDASAAGVEFIVDVAEALPSSKLAVENARKYPGIVFAAVGVDPHVLIPKDDDYFRKDLLAAAGMEAEMQGIKDLLDEFPEEIVMIGETGLDDYWYQELRESGKLGVSEAEGLQLKQEMLFRMHLELAAQYDLPLTIHSRAAEPRCIQIASEYHATGIFHSYTGDYQTAKQILDAGYALGINGIVTFKKSYELREVFSKILGKVSSDWSPQDFYDRGIYFETDAPFLAPEGKRGERNKPANIAGIFSLSKEFL